MSARPASSTPQRFKSSVKSKPKGFFTGTRCSTEPLPLLVLVAAWLSWVYFVPYDFKIYGVLVACVYSCIEYSWYSLSTEHPDGSVQFTPFVSARSSMSVIHAEGDTCDRRVLTSRAMMTRHAACWAHMTPSNSAHYANAPCVSLTAQAKTSRQGFTSFAQWWANVLYLPVGFPLYRLLIAPAWLRIALFPLNLWLLEIIEGYARPVCLL